MKVISREAAKTEGLSRYFSETPCKHGHISERRVINNACMACVAIGDKRRYERDKKNADYVANNRKRALKWQRANADRYRERQRKWNDEHRAEKRAYSQEYQKRNAAKRSQKLKQARKENPDHFRELGRRRREKPGAKEKARKLSQKWRKANAERYKARVQRYRKANIEKLRIVFLANTHNRRRYVAAGDKVTAAQLREVRARGCCAVCGATEGPMHIDHKVPLSKGGRHELSNLQLLCRSCNLSKSWKDQTEWLQERQEHDYPLTPLTE